MALCGRSLLLIVLVFVQKIILAGLLTLLATVPPLGAQKTVPLPVLPDRGCELPIVREDVLHYRPYTFKDRPRPKAMTFTFDYLEDGRRMFGDTCVTWPAEAKAAFEYAATIWADVLENDIPVDISACYSPDMAPGTLGSASPQLVALYGFMGDTVIMPQALAENIVGSDIGGTDIFVIMNQNFNFYYGTDANPPPGQVDFVTLSVHELGHGLGFVGAAAVDDGDGTNGVECDNVAGSGCVGLHGDYFGTGVARPYPYVYDLFADRGSDGVRLLDLPNPGPEIGDALLGQAAGLLFDGSNQSEYYPATDAFGLYAPPTFRNGSSYSHFADNSEVLYYALSYGSAIHDVGTASEVMQNIGWPRAIPPASVLPVTWQSFTAEYDGKGAWLYWSTASETDNAGFHVEVSRNGAPFTTLRSVPATGGTGAGGRYRYYDPRPAAGINHYRIRQTDLDGAVNYSYVVGVRVEVSENVIGYPFPNPSGRHSVQLPVRSGKAGLLTVRLIDATGRPRTQRTVELGVGEVLIPIDLTGVPPGVQVLVLEREGTRTYRRVVVP